MWFGVWRPTDVFARRLRTFGAVVQQCAFAESPKEIAELGKSQVSCVEPRTGFRAYLDAMGGE
jgi:hypothetical protein